MAKRSRIKPQDNPKLEMTPMIDVVFQLLIFFIVTLKQEDILSQLSAAAPAPDSNATEKDQPDLINIDVFKNNEGLFLFNKYPVSRETLEENIRRLSLASKESNIVIRCTPDSPHQYLVQALDVCNKYGMTKLSIFSL